MQDLIKKINQLMHERNAVILVHNYQIPEVQELADFLGDSLGLSIEAAKTKADVIVFCGVNFMAETAKILSPQKKVIMPDLNAGCPMADMVNADQVRELKKKHPGAAVVTYVNSSAAVKAESDICCTSANGVKVVKSLKAKEIIFVPDKYLGHYISTQVPEKKFIFWNGYCPSHMRIMPDDVISAKKEHPEAYVMVHPECRPEVIELADAALSTSQMIKKAGEIKNNEFIIGTETGILYTLHKKYPDKKFYPASEKCICPNMKLTTAEKVLFALEDMKNEITVPKEIADKARSAIEKMIKIV
ncbi:MAG: quinolinate synthase NadA [Candidatus Margulisbacteria bacterium]|nr:quinolinate synthase NadA [Candidatus Margulisiibacteriota bacterium]MBU1022442.1 quinolinate synthase NadA [Candidatus Margulisiibacteriota bacterium]MBU1728426.1 quinolinate synthase NadA [Candidatus Margulisiibacteriota bacterium]MBU1954573.1 quinolinate synthase NadA [Candidatus Margulisiibacteriota bacterium]